MANRLQFSAIVLIVAGLFSQSLQAQTLQVFISAFAPGEKGAIHAYEFHPKQGRLELLQRTSDVEHPFFLALSPDRKYLYSIHAPGQFGGEKDEQVAAYRILDDRGNLKLLNRKSAKGTAACYLDVDATGKTVVVANYSSGSVASLSVSEDGSLGEISAFVQHDGSSVNPDRQQEPHAHCIVVSPDNRFAFAADLGLDQVVSYKLDSERGLLSSAKQRFARTPPGAGPRHLTFHPNGRYLYVINELKNSVTLFDYNSETGVLIERQTISTLPDRFEGESYCADLKVTPNGKFLFGTNRGHDSIARYRIADDGRLTLLGIEPSLGKGPQNLAITPDGKLLICANMPGNNVAVFRIDTSGELKSAGDPLEMPSPSCIMIR